MTTIFSSKKYSFCYVQFFLIRSVDGKVRNYDIRMGQLRVDCIGQPVTSVNFTRDGQCVLASTLDDTIRLMDKDTGELLNELVRISTLRKVIRGSTPYTF